MTSCAGRTDPSTWGRTFTTRSRGTVGSARCAGGGGDGDDSGYGFFGPFVGGEGGTGRFVVTTGDASHAMPPFLGQGANQALQE